jgi:RNA polymerase sigma factor (sigma-70 family)
MPGDGSVTHWLNRLASEEESVAERELFGRYFGKLVEFARLKLQSAPRAVEDEEDLAISAMHSFFRRASGGQFPKLSNRNELWTILITIVARKAVNRLKKDQALKRGGTPNGQNDPRYDGAGHGSALIQLISKQPTPDMLAELNEELLLRLNGLDGELLREVALLRLQGFTNMEIAEQLGVAERTVRRKTERIRREWTEAVD